MILRAYIGTTGLTDVAARFYLVNATAGASVTPATEEGKGWYSADMGTLPAEGVADHVRWSSAGDATIDAREDLAPLQKEIALATGVNVATINGATVNGAGTSGDLWRGA
jgi:hypothetical protein